MTSGAGEPSIGNSITMGSPALTLISLIPLNRPLLSNFGLSFSGLALRIMPELASLSPPSFTAITLYSYSLPVVTFSSKKFVSCLKENYV